MTKSISALKKAIQLERDGIDFYLKSAKKTKNIFTKMIFEGLAREEENHIKAINKIYEDLKNKSIKVEWVTAGDEGNIEKVFQKALIERAKRSKSDLEALKLGLDLEDKSVKYYERLAKTSEDNFERRFYLTLAYEERGHYIKIMDAMEYISNPTGWYYVKERSMVDGG